MKQRLKRSFAAAAILLEGFAVPVHAQTVGTPIIPAVAVATIPQLSAGSAVARDAAGNFVVLWEESYAAGVAEYATSAKYRRFSANGAALSDTAVLPADARNVSVAMGPSGDFVFSWVCPKTNARSGRKSLGVCARSFNADGSPASAIVAVGEGVPQGTHTNDSVMGLTSVAMDEAGNFVVGWLGILRLTNGDSATSFVYTRRFHLDGKAYGSSQKIDSANFTHAVDNVRIAMQGSGDYTVSWKYEVTYLLSGTYTVTEKVQSFTPRGTPKSRATEVALPRGWSNAQFTTASNGGFFAAHETNALSNPTDPTSSLDYLLEYQRYSANGSAVGSPVVVAVSQFDYYNISVAPSSAGGLTLAWTDENGLTSARAYDADDQALGNAFTIDNAGPEFVNNSVVRYPLLSLVLDAADNPLVVWNTATNTLTAQLFQGR